MLLRFALLAVFAFTLIPATARAEQNAQRIAVVNFTQVFRAYKRVGDISQKMGAYFEPEREVLKRERVAIETRREVLSQDPRPKDDPQLFKDYQQLELDDFNWKAKWKKLNAEFEERKMREMRLMLNDIHLAISAVGGAEKFNIVLRAPEFEELFDAVGAVKGEKKEDKDDEKKTGPQTSLELVRAFREAQVLYFTSDIDITDKVVKKLNEDYEKAK